MAKTADALMFAIAKVNQQQPTFVPAPTTSNVVSLVLASSMSLFTANSLN
jgi:hypothetical protein